jgi:hypothetical protein
LAVTWLRLRSSRWRVVAVDTAPPLLAEEGFDARWIVE